MQWEHPKLDFQEISKFLSELNEWSVNDNQEMIFKKFKFSNFKKAYHLQMKLEKLQKQKVITLIYLLVGDIV